MQSWLGKQLISYTMARSRAGDVAPTLRLEADDVRLRFPGDNSWSGEFVGKAEVELWLRRMARVGVQTFPDEVVVKGFPWNTTVCVRGHDHVKSPSGETVYENRFVIWGRMAWGKLKDYEVYEDTIAPRALDEYIEANKPALMAF
jgi:ketosteroid isomerase-like protein